MIFIEILQLSCYAVPELPPSRNPLHNCNADKNHTCSRLQIFNSVMFVAFYSSSAAQAKYIYFLIYDFGLKK